MLTLGAIEAIGEFHHKTNGKDEGPWLFWILKEKLVNELR